MRKQAIQLANALRGVGFSLKEAMKRAWYVIHLQVKMDTVPTTFRFIKRDGTEREATGFYDAAPVWDYPTQRNPLVIRYYDTIKCAWRRFRADRLILA